MLWLIYLLNCPIQLISKDIDKVLIVVHPIEVLSVPVSLVT